MKFTTLMNGMDLPELSLSSKGCGMGLNIFFRATYGIAVTTRWISISKITTDLEESGLTKISPPTSTRAV